MSTEDATSNEVLDVVIVGAGLAGVEAAFALREQGHRGRITLIGKENFAPYSRPPLSKGYLKGEGLTHDLWIRPQSAYEQQDIELILGVEVTEIARKERKVWLNNGEFRRYGKLVLCVGGEANALKIPGADLPGVCVLKSLQDAEDLRLFLRPSSRVVVIGGGFVGMEFAATALTLGCQVTVLESQQKILSRALAPEISEYLQTEHQKRGVEVLTEVSVARIEDLQGGKSVVMQDDRILLADLVLVSVGNFANEDLASSCGLKLNRGILVDFDGRTSDPHIFAAGDCTTVVREGFSLPTRLESVHNAIFQAKRAAAALLNKAPCEDETPWFWSEQFDIKLLMAGLPLPGDTRIIRGAPAEGRFSVIYQNEHQMTAIQCVNSAADFAAAKKMIAERRVFDPVLLKDETIKLRDIRHQTPVFNDCSAEVPI